MITKLINYKAGDLLLLGQTENYFIMINTVLRKQYQYGTFDIGTQFFIYDRIDELDEGTILWTDIFRELKR